MTRKLKLLGLALMAALAVNSVAVDVASADVVTSEASSTKLTGIQEGVDAFTFHAGATQCTTVRYTGSISGTSSSSISITPFYFGCVFVGLGAVFDLNGCSYRMNINSTVANTTATTDIVCPTGKEITITAPSPGTPKCIIHIPPQTGLAPISVANIGSGTTRELTASLAITNIKYSQTAGTAETGNCATADNTTGGTYLGSTIFTGESSTTFAHIGIFFS